MSTLSVQHDRIRELDPLPLHAPSRIHAWLYQAWEKDEREVGHWILNHCDRAISLTFDTDQHSWPQKIIKKAWKTGDTYWLDRFLDYGVDIDYLVDSKTSALQEVLRLVAKTPSTLNPFQVAPLQKIWGTLLAHSSRMGGFSSRDDMVSEVMAKLAQKRLKNAQKAGLECDGFTLQWNELIHQTQAWEKKMGRQMGQAKEVIAAFKRKDTIRLRRALPALAALPAHQQVLNVYHYAFSNFTDPHQCVEVVKMLHQSGFCVNARQPNGVPALAQLCTLSKDMALAENEEVFDCLVQLGANPNQCSGASRQDDGHSQRFSALSAAAYYNKQTFVDKLIDLGALVNHQESSGRTALHEALEYHAWDIAWKLIESGAQPAIRADRGEDALGALMSSTTMWEDDTHDQVTKFARKLTQQYRLNLDRGEHDGETPRMRSQADPQLARVLAQLQQEALQEATPQAVWVRPTRRF